MERGRGGFKSDGGCWHAKARIWTESGTSRLRKRTGAQEK